MLELHTHRLTDRQRIDVTVKAEEEQKHGWRQKQKQADINIRSTYKRKWQKHIGIRREKDRQRDRETESDRETERQRVTERHV